MRHYIEIVIGVLLFVFAIWIGAYFKSLSDWTSEPGIVTGIVLAICGLLLGVHGFVELEENDDEST